MGDRTLIEWMDWYDKKTGFGAKKLYSQSYPIVYQNIKVIDHVFLEFSFILFGNFYRWSGE